MPAIILDLQSDLKKLWQLYAPHYECYCGESFCDGYCYSCEMRLERGCCTQCLLIAAGIVNIMTWEDQDAGTGFLILWSNGMVTFDGENGRLVYGEYWRVYYTVQLEPDPVKKAEAEAKLKQMDKEMR
jgi:hypothetical protein